MYVSPCAQYAERNNGNGVNRNVVRIVPAFFEIPACNEYCQAHTCNYAKRVNVNREAEHYQRRVTYIPHKAECIVAPHKLFFRKSPCYSRQKTKQNNYFLLSGLSHAAADVTKAYIIFIFYYFNEMLSIACVFVATRLATLYADLYIFFDLRH